ncbi:MAG: hypothetical protein JNJ77_00265 [Planctomycetia bacterium]|nr:hypothetical protein [Planctomycetia bacterium]
MFGKAKKPIDRMPYPRSVSSKAIDIGIPPGRYAYAVDIKETIHVVPDGLHVHPKILGNAREALYAGELAIDTRGIVSEINNLSGTFRFRSQRSLCGVAERLRMLGFSVKLVMWYCPFGTRIRQLNC